MSGLYSVLKQKKEKCLCLTFLISTLFCHLCTQKITKENIQEFKQELSIFAESFNMHGPGAVGDDLEKGALR